MQTKILIDTNVLVYAYDFSQPLKQQQALEILERLANSELGVLSTQTLAEFFAVSTRKIPNRLSVKQAYEQIEQFIGIWPVLSVNSQVVLTAARGVYEYQFNFWDAQLWAVAYLHNVPTVFSEDFHSDAIVEGIRFVNPFGKDFHPNTWGI